MPPTMAVLTQTRQANEALQATGSGKTIPDCSMERVEVGQLGIVASITSHGAGQDAWNQIDVVWDNGRTLMLVSPPDRFEIVRRGPTKP